MTLRSADGYRIVRDALTPAQSASLATAIASRLGVEDHTGATPVHFTLGAALSVPGSGDLLGPRVLDVLREEIGEPIALAVGVDTIALNGSEEDFHRDSSYAQLPSAQGEDDPRYGVVRVICYPSAHGSTNVFRIVPGSHRPGVGTDDAASSAVDLALGPTDVLLFDARCVHAGAPPQGTKALVVLTCGPDNVLTAETAEHEWRNLRESGYDVPGDTGALGELPPDAVRMLLPQVSV